MSVVRRRLTHRAPEGRGQGDEVVASEDRAESVGHAGTRRFGRAEFIVGAAPAGIEPRPDDGVVFFAAAFEPAGMDACGGVAAEDRIGVGRVGAGEA